MDFLKNKFGPLASLLIVIWVVEILNLFAGHSLSVWGILPRDTSGLIGIPFAPFLHGSLLHAVSNTVPLLILGGLAILSFGNRFVSLTVVIITLSGIGVWLFGRDAYHVGASGLIFGYFGALLASAFIDRRLSSVLTALITVVLYGGLVFGLLPLVPGVSVESHFFGLISGVAFVWYGRQRRPKKQTGQ
ncbi:MAG: rhomboid family intramembrane serine protease [Sneathiella sp.]